MQKQSFTMIELIIVIVVISILLIKANFTLANTSLNQAADQIINHINLTRQLALKDNKFQYYPIDNSATEGNRSKYWFKQWWQIRFSKRKNNDDFYYEVFSDVPYVNDSYSNPDKYNFSRVGNTPKTLWNESYAKNPLNRLYLIGISKKENSKYPENADTKLNLTKYYGIKKVKINGIAPTSHSSKRFIFDNYGNVYTSEGDAGDAGDINPYDKDKRIPLTSIAKITLCQDNDCSNEDKKISICITPKVGFAYICK